MEINLTYEECIIILKQKLYQRGISGLLAFYKYLVQSDK